MKINRITQLFQTKKKNVLSIYFCAGYPTLNSTKEIIQTLVENNIDLIEIGIPFSDPIADGTIIQQATKKAIENGMTLNKLFNQLKDIRNTICVPLVLMGYINPILAMGVDIFCQKCDECGIDGVIIPDLPYENYENNFKKTISKYKVRFIALISPKTSSQRIKEIDKNIDSFIYVVSSNAITGTQPNFTKEQESYFASIKSMNLQNPHLIGFGISNYQTAQKAQQKANGIIIGSKFISLLMDYQNPKLAIIQLLNDINTPR